MRSKSVISCVDKWIVLIYILLVFIGWLSIYSSSYNFDDVGIFDPNSRSFKQLIWFGISLFVGFIILMSDEYLYEDLTVPIYTGMMLLLLATVFLAPSIKGSRSWLVFGPISFQPAEFSKFATALLVSKIASNQQFSITRVKSLVMLGLAVATPFLIILMQHETGSALVYASLILVMFRQGLSSIVLSVLFYMILYFVLVVKYGNQPIEGATMMGNVLCGLIAFGVLLFHLYYRHSRKEEKQIKIIGVGFAVSTLIGGLLSHFFSFDLGTWMLYSLLVVGGYVLILFFKHRLKRYLFASLFLLASLFYIVSVDYLFDYVLQPHQQLRIKVSLGIEEDLQGAGYNVNQSIIAIGSGGALGKGYLNGTQTKLKYVPEQDTDFIFCTVGEEWGFVGSFIVILLYATLIIRLIQAAERQSRAFARIYGYCVMCVFLFHFTINIGMVIGLVPVIGIPLPLFSYGGSSLLAFTILLFIFLRMDAGRKI